MKNNQIPYLIMVATVAIVAIIVILFNGSARLEGAPVYKKQTTAFHKLCVDSDPNNDYSVQGIAHFGTLKYYDFCRGKKVYQYYCGTDNMVRLTRGFACTNGCFSGICSRGGK